MEECCLLACSPWIVQPASLLTHHQDHQPKGITTQDSLDMSTSIANQKMPLPMGKFYGDIFSMENLYSQITPTGLG